MILSVISTSWKPVDRHYRPQRAYESKFFKDRESKVVLSKPISDIKTFEYFIFSDKDTIQEALEIIDVCKIELPAEEGKELALMPASDFGLQWHVGGINHTNLLYKIASKKDQIPMILVLRPIT